MAFVIALPCCPVPVRSGRSGALCVPVHALDDAAHAVCEAASGHPAGDVARSSCARRLLRRRRSTATICI
ncbi:MAG: hypothetical protein ACLTMP_01870 [Eggerthella lenta]